MRSVQRGLGYGTMAALPARFRNAPDPAGATRLFERLLAAGLGPDAAAQTSGDLAELIWIACAEAPYLAILATRDPDRLVGAASDPYLRREKPRDLLAAELARALEGVTTEDALLAALRSLRAREMVRLGARECGLGQRAEVGRELANLAEVTLEAALAFHDAELRRTVGNPRHTADDGTVKDTTFSVIAMGKLGGQELNFASDIDLVYLYASDNGTAGTLSLHEYFEKLARRVTRALGAVTEDDVVFRVDLRLRPEGSRGPLTNSLASAERYYESWGRPWERQAWLKARPAAGDPQLGAEALLLLEPFIYPRSQSASVVAEVEELNRRIKAELDGKGIRAGFDVKLGRGGIREVEFFVQALQLVHAGKLPALRERSTRRALDKLLFAGLIADRERRLLGDAYDFLRHVEHLLQLEAGQQTHRIPSDFGAITTLARRLGCEDAGELAALIARHTDAVAAVFDTLGGAPEVRAEIYAVCDAERAPADVTAALGRLGFRDPEDAAFQIELLRKRPFSPLGRAASSAAARLAPRLLEELAASPDPDQALRFLVDLASSLGGWEGPWVLLGENPPILRLLVSLLGSSAFLARSLVEHPDLLEHLLAGARGPLSSGQALATRLKERLAAVPVADEESAWNAIRRVHHEEIFRIGLADIAGEQDEMSVAGELSDLAEACLAGTYDLVRGALLRRVPRLAPMVILGLGKLGGRELGYASDLDLVFVYDGDLDDQGHMTKLAQRLVNALGAVLAEGRLYAVDTRLRPSGSEGMLVSSLGAWRSYHRDRARLWERQALIKARPVAGDPSLAAELRRDLEATVYECPRMPDAEIAAALHGMRTRIETELGREGKRAQGGDGPDTYDIKLGRGGLVDVEFAVQYLQLVFGPLHPELRVPSTLEALRRAAELGLLGEHEASTLAGGYRFLRKLEHRIRIVHDRPVHALPRDAVEQGKLARRMGFPSATAMERAYRSWTDAVRACYLTLLRVDEV